MNYPIPEQIKKMKKPDFKFFEVPNVISDDQCDILIDFHREHPHLLDWEDKALQYNGRKINFQNIMSDHIRIIMKRLEYIAIGEIKRNTNQLVFPEQTELMRWPIGCEQDAHVDIYSDMSDDDPSSFVIPKTEWASIVYLNDNFKGGKTIFTPCEEIPLGFEFVPKKGSMILFQGLYFLHAVTKVYRNDRYTVPMWFTNDFSTMRPDYSPPPAQIS